MLGASPIKKIQTRLNFRISARIKIITELTEPFKKDSNESVGKKIFDRNQTIENTEIRVNHLNVTEKIIENQELNLPKV